MTTFKINLTTEEAAQIVAALGFVRRKAAYTFATFVLFGFAEVLPWWEFENKYPHRKN